MTALHTLENAPVDPIGRQRRVVKAHAGGVGQRVGQRRRDWIDRRLAHRLGAERTERVVRVGEIDLGTLRDVGIGRNAVVAKVSD